jgi:glutamyl-tRNA synthetase
VASPRFRFAPSPTGYLHLGSARTALFNWLEARRTGGEMLLRIEDTDPERSRGELVQGILDSLRWLGLTWDGEIVSQAERLDLHRDAAMALLDAGRAYWCDCTTEAVQARAAERGGTPGYDGHCAERGLARGAGTALRFRVPDAGSTTFTDLVRGEVGFRNATIEDFVLLRANGTPVFLLSNAVDDADMGITHVVRGEDHVPGTPKYLLIRDALGLGRPEVFAHLPLLVNESRRKLSKRKDSVAVEEFRAQGYLPEAMVNHLALCGWGPPDGIEVRPLGEIVELFRLSDVNPSPAFYDVRKLQAFNAEYIRALPVADFVERSRPFLSRGEEAEAVLVAIAALVQERVRLLREVEPMIAFLLDEPLEIDQASWGAEVQGHRAPAEVLDVAGARLASLQDWSASGIEAVMAEVATTLGYLTEDGRAQLGKVQGPVRVATTGRRVGPPLWESLEVLGRERTLARLAEARRRLDPAG